ncbi:hypothetical protein FFF34_000315 [Inquilinus sp. KBS0705]|nr:hypothetical protein FFF34_000315 [Inquilinus sp. KBS0705]
MNNKLAVIVIPIHKATLNANEVISLKQCLKILKDYPIVFACSKNLNTTHYQKIMADNAVLFKTEHFNDIYFKSSVGYNKLMLTPDFYKAFLDYQYLLIYQLDVYVFKDDLKYWCKQNYDYIGAPLLPHENRENEMQFLKGYSKILNFINRTIGTNFKIKNVGNGGFSLRKVKKCYWLLTLSKSKVAAWGTNHEDGFFRYWGNIFSPIFKLPTDEVALHFSIEHSPKQSLKILGGEMPFGCHAFEKFEPHTWKLYIKDENFIP